MADIAQFIRDRIADDQHITDVEAVLRDGDPYWQPGGEASVFERRIGPARIAAQCRALLVVVDAVSDMQQALDEEFGSISGEERALAALASIWRDHPKFDPTWLESLK
jgi:hypothetical protein